MTLQVNQSIVFRLFLVRVVFPKYSIVFLGFGIGVMLATLAPFYTATCIKCMGSTPYEAVVDSNFKLLLNIQFEFEPV